jgi:uncharacterized protein (DUF488 family)
VQPRIVTIGVYGFDQGSFFAALLNAHLDVFCDIRRRRGMRGSTYAFANSTRLQQRLQELGIRYMHMKELAPAEAVREQQVQEDQKLHIAKRTRTMLSENFIRAYEDSCLAAFDSQQFLQKVGPDANVIGLFCVEREPEACHRSLAAKKLAQDLGCSIEHIRP